MSNSLDVIPDISFTNDLTYEDVRANLISFYLDKYKEITGEDAVLQAGSRERMELDACAIMFFQILQVIEYNGKMNNLKTSEGEYLDNIGALFHQIRTPAEPAKTVLRFYISQAQNFAVSIPEGTEASAGDIIFATDEYAQIEPGMEYVDVDASCTDAGSQANGLVPGEINTIMKDIPYIESVYNMEETHDGKDMLSDDDFRELIFLSNGTEYSGTEDGYEYRARKINPDIEDIRITSEESGVVNILFTTSDGGIPSDGECTYLQQQLSRKDWKESTDKIEVSAPEVVEYEINVTYYLYSADDLESAEQQLHTAVENFQRWQSGRIGRDINNSKLIYMLQNTCVKRIECTSPSYQKISGNQIAKASSVQLVYGGVEDD